MDAGKGAGRAIKALITNKIITEIFGNLENFAYLVNI